MKKRSPEQELNALCRHIRQEIKQWESINQYGCNDPFWDELITRHKSLYVLKKKWTNLLEKFKK